MELLEEPGTTRHGEESYFTQNRSQMSQSMAQYIQPEASDTDINVATSVENNNILGYPSESDADRAPGNRARPHDDYDDSQDNVNLDSFDGAPGRRNRPSDDI